MLREDPRTGYRHPTLKPASTQQIPLEPASAPRPRYQGQSNFGPASFSNGPGSGYQSTGFRPAAGPHSYGQPFRPQQCGAMGQAHMRAQRKRESSLVRANQEYHQEIAEANQAAYERQYHREILEARCQPGKRRNSTTMSAPVFQKRRPCVNSTSENDPKRHNNVLHRFLLLLRSCNRALFLLLLLLLRNRVPFLRPTS